MPWNPPVTSNLPANKVTVTTFDEIAENQVYLKERADVVDANQTVKTSDDVTFNSVTTVTVNATSIPTVNSTTINNSGNINPTTTSTLGSWNLTTTPIIIPRGIYSIRNITGSSPYSRIQMQTTPGTWTTIVNGGEVSVGSSSEGALVFSDGVNFRAYMNTSTGTMYYRRF